jgi:hypothetical protein
VNAYLLIPRSSAPGGDTDVACAESDVAEMEFSLAVNPRTKDRETGERREEVRYRYEPLLAADEIVADGVDLVITLDDGRRLRYQPCEEDD